MNPYSRVDTSRGRERVLTSHMRPLPLALRELAVDHAVVRAVDPLVVLHLPRLFRLNFIGVSMTTCIPLTEKMPLHPRVRAGKRG